MGNWRITALSVVALLGLLGSADVARSQSRSSSTTTTVPGGAVREGNRSMDDYDRTLNRMKNDAKANAERRRNLFPQINEDFQRLQVIHNEIVRMIQPDKSLDYDRLSELTGDMKKHGTRLRDNLALPPPEKTEAQDVPAETIDETHIKKTIADMHDLVVSFVGSPLFTNLRVVDAKVIDSASQNLDSLIRISDELKREAKILGKSARN